MSGDDGDGHVASTTVKLDVLAEFELRRVLVLPMVKYKKIHCICQLKRSYEVICLGGVGGLSPIAERVGVVWMFLL